MIKGLFWVYQNGLNNEKFTTNFCAWKNNIKVFIDQESIDDLNKKYENHKNKLDNFGKRLAGRIDDEKNITSIFENTKAFRPIINCMNDYVEELKSLKY